VQPTRTQLTRDPLLARRSTAPTASEWAVRAATSASLASAQIGRQHHDHGVTQA